MAFWLTLQDHGMMKALGGVCTLGDSQTHTPVNCLGEVLTLEFACAISQNFETPTH